MQPSSIFPQLFTHYYVSTIQLKSLLSILITGGLIRRRHFVEHFLGCCFHSGSSDLALSTFAASKIRNVSLQNLILRGLGNYGLYEDVLSVYKNCRALRCPSDDFTFPVVIKACTILGAFRKGEQIHGLVLKSGYGENVVVGTALVDFYAKSGFLGHARSLIDEIPQPDLVSLNALLAGYSLHGLDHEALEVFKRVFDLGLKPNSSTLATVIPVCSRSGRLDFGRSLHGYAVKSGSFTTDVLVPALISMYAGGHGLHLSSARMLFNDCYPRKNVAVWNSMISAYAQSQMPSEAIEVFQEMLHAELEPDVITFVSIIPSCDHVNESSSFGESLHGFVIKHGSELKIPVTTALLSMYAKLGDISKAELLFSSMPYKSLLSWNVMVSGYARSGQWYKSRAAFREMQLAGLSPDAASIVSVLSACSELMEAKSAQGFCIRKGIDSRINVSSALLGFYSECDHMAYCFNLFQRSEESRDIISWNTMISARVRRGEVEEAICLLQQMQKEGMRKDMVTLISILPICGNLYDGKAIHCYAVKSGADSDVSLVNALITMYCKCEEGEEMETGRWLFEAMTKKSVVSWNSLVSGYINHNRINEVWILLDRMIAENQWPNSVTLLNLLPLCCSLCRRCTDVSSWNAIISAHIQTQNPEKALELFHHGLVEMGLQPDHITLLSLISAAYQLNSSKNLIDSITAYVLIKKGFGRDTSINNALIDSYAKTGNISTARMVFDSFQQKNAGSWNVMINGYGLHGDGESAVELFLKMKSSGFRPDHTTFSTTLSACSHARLVRQGLMVFESMAETGLQPRIEQYGCMVDLLGRTGHLMEASEIVRNVGDHPRIIDLLESLLGACRVYGDVEVAERVHHTMMMSSGRERASSGSYVALSNLYAGVGRWEDAGGARSNLDSQKLKKSAGFSVVL
ncbi:unnamed protein product [Linum tenue]|uniref:Pentatricopeptide repeat-containing protein n=1 Tax=Linum tenue TaxID=586396 RepID=A0AAV0R7E4_9ROSI|nr:unnamed protein product [Linum tenue]